MPLLENRVSDADLDRLRATATSARVLVVGSLNVDLILEADDEPPDEGAVTVRSARTLVGGHAGNCAAALAALGVSVGVAGAVGADPDGELLVADLEARGVDVSAVHRRTSVPTGRVVIPVFGEKHYMMLIRGANDTFGAAELLDAMNGGFDAVMLFDPGIEALRALRRPDASTVCWTPGGVNAAHPVAAHVASQSDVVFVNRAERRRLAVDVAGELVVTSGGEGSVLCVDGRETAVPARRVRVVDPTGAGDAFAATYVLARLAGFDPECRLAAANFSGSVAVGATGARSRSATLRDLLLYLSPEWNSVTER